MEEFNESGFRESLARFDGVWRRVTSAEELSSPTASEDAQLLDFLRCELCAAEQDAALARQLQGTSRTVLFRNAHAARRRAARLRAEYFIRTGEMCSRTRDCPAPERALAGLRAALRRDGRAARDYESAAKETRDPLLRALYEEYSRERGDAAREVRSLILRAFTV